MFRIFLNRVMAFIRPSIIMSGLGGIFDLWRSAGTRERGIFLLVFAPMFACVGGLLFSIVRFVLFVMPSFVLGFFGWGLLIAIFGWGGRYCYAYFTGNNTAYSYSSNSASSTNSANSRNYNYNHEDASYTDVKFIENTK